MTGTADSADTRIRQMGQADRQVVLVDARMGVNSRDEVTPCVLESDVEGGGDGPLWIRQHSNPAVAESVHQFDRPVMGDAIHDQHLGRRQRLGQHRGNGRDDVLFFVPDRHYHRHPM